MSTNGHHVTAAHAGHYVQLQQPEIVSNAILEVLQKNGYNIE
jgi:pimeloyl-ACP methyl ester carboxylesterase